jgi:hypothetical protein
MSVSFPVEPGWLRTALDCRSSMEWCALLETMGIHDAAHGLLCGCTKPSNPHCSVPNPLSGVPWTPRAAGPLRSWAAYYAWRGLTSDSHVALLLSWPLTVYLCLLQLGLTGLQRPVSVHYLGPEKEVMLLPLFLQALAELLPTATIVIDMVGPLGIPLPATTTCEGACGGSVTISVHKGLYHTVGLPQPDVAIAPNAGLSVIGYADRWPETLRYIHEKRIPFVFTDYSEQSVEKGLALAAAKFGMAPSSTGGVVLNPFRMPLREPLVRGGAVGFPTVSNGFLAAFHTPPGAFANEATLDLN